MICRWGDQNHFFQIFVFIIFFISLCASVCVGGGMRGMGNFSLAHGGHLSLQPSALSCVVGRIYFVTWSQEWFEKKRLHKIFFFLDRLKKKTISRSNLISRTHTPKAHRFKFKPKKKNERATRKSQINNHNSRSPFYAPLSLPPFLPPKNKYGPFFIFWLPQGLFVYERDEKKKKEGEQMMNKIPYTYMPKKKK